MTDQLDALKQMTDAQAAQVRAAMLESGQLPPPAHLPTLSAAQMPASLDALRDALSGNAMAWGQRAPDGSALAHFAHGLLYAGVMLNSCRTLDPAPHHALAVFTTWAAGFARDVLDQAGVSEGVIDEALGSPVLSPQLLAALPDNMARGAAGAALGVFCAAAHSYTYLDPDHLMTLLALAGREVAGPDFIPSKGEGLRA